MVNFPSAPDTGWPSFSQVMLGSGLPLAVQGKRAWAPSVMDRLGRPVLIAGGTVGVRGVHSGTGAGLGWLTPVPVPLHLAQPQPLLPPHLLDPSLSPGHKPLPVVCTAWGFSRVW